MKPLRKRSTGGQRPRGLLGIVSATWAAACTLAAIAPADPAPSPEPAGAVLARVGDRSITAGAFTESWGQTHTGGSHPLTPDEAGQFLEVLIDRELALSQALRRRWTWTEADRADTAAVRDRVAMRTALDQIVIETRRAEPSLPDAEAAGVRAREQAVAALEPEWTDTVIARVAAAFAALPAPSSDSSLASQLRALSASPSLDAALEPAMLAHTRGAGDVTAAQVVTTWSALSPAVRPRIASPEHVREIAENLLFERWLRTEARRRGLDRSPDAAAAVAKTREQIAIRHWMAEEIAAGPDPGERDLVRFHRELAAEWSIPRRVRATRLVLDDARNATLMAIALRNRAEAESLVARGHRRGVEYQGWIDADRDSALFERAYAAEVGTVLGPDPEGESWAVTRVEAIHPARIPLFEEVRDAVRARWLEERTAAQLRAALDRERRRTSITRYPDRLDFVTMTDAETR